MRAQLSRRMLPTAIALVMVALASSTAAQTNLGKVSIDVVTNQISATHLMAGSTHRVAIRYDFTGLPASPPYYTTQNSFELYSPDGANWVNLLASDGPILSSLSPTTSKFRKYYTSSDDGVSFTATAFGGTTQPGPNTGPGSRVAYSLFTQDLISHFGFAGGAGGSNGIAMYLEFQSLIADNGRTICFDTVNGRGTRPWEWTDGSTADFPLWDNGLGFDVSRCWEISLEGPIGIEWCFGTTGNVSFAYCSEGSFQLCAVDPEGGPLTYEFAAGYESGFGSLDPQTGLWTWSGPTVPQTGFLDIEFRVSDGFDYALDLFVLHVSITGTGCDCCTGRVGDANGVGGDEPTISDVSVLIAALFLSGGCTEGGESLLDCLAECDVNQSGGLNPTCYDITIGDISTLIDYLFITGSELGLPNCL